MEKGRRIRAVLLTDGAMQQKTMLVLERTDAGVTVLLGAKKQPVTLPLDAILSCDYARGDHGED